MVRPNPTQPPGSGFNPPSKEGGGGSSGNSQIKPVSLSLLTSTGGLSGSIGMLVTPAFNPSTGATIIITDDPTSFDCEEAANYYFRQEANYGQQPGEGRTCTVHEIVLKYRELGKASFFINIDMYNRVTDDFSTYTIPITVPSVTLSKARQKTFPDGKIHTILINPTQNVIQGERPQAYITRNAKTGPCCITKILLRGNADEMSPQ